MKKNLLFTFIVLLSYSDIIYQNITFDKSYPQFIDYKTIGIVQRRDSSYLLAAYKNDLLKTVLLDKHGIVTSETDVPFKTTYINLAYKNPLCINSD
jgi:hypothetical protein